MVDLDYEKIKRDLRAGNVTKFRKSPLYSDVLPEQAEPIEKRYIDGKIDLQEFTVLLASIHRSSH
jgi:hypothetical protein